MVERGWKAHVLGKADHTFKDAGTAIKTLRVTTLAACQSHFIISHGVLHASTD